MRQLTIFATPQKQDRATAFIQQICVTRASNKLAES